MARPEEKAMGLLNRWTQYQNELRLGITGSERPKFAGNCQNLPDAIRFRSQILQQISQKVEEIQNAALGEHRIRELNDEINRLLKEKYTWEVQIKSLGGHSFPSSVNRKYKYFGAARELPQVRELLAAHAPKESTKRKREEIMKNITYKYYESLVSEEQDFLGLLDAEAREEVRLRQEAKSNHDFMTDESEEIDYEPSEFDEMMMKTMHYSSKSFLSDKERIELDTSKAMERLLVERKKKDLIAKFNLAP